VSDQLPEGLPPIEPSADMRQMALFHRQMFLAYTGAGFSDQQALMILGTMIAASFRPDTGQ